MMSQKFLHKNEMHTVQKARKSFVVSRVSIAHHEFDYAIFSRITEYWRFSEQVYTKFPWSLVIWTFALSNTASPFFRYHVTGFPQMFSIESISRLSSGQFITQIILWFKPLCCAIRNKYRCAVLLKGQAGTT